MMIIIRSILLSKNPSACFHMLGKNVLKDWNATFASYCCCFPQTTQEKPLLKLKISKSHLLCCGKLGGLHCLLLLTDILFRSVSAPLWSFVTRFNKFSHWEMATKNWVKHRKFNHWRKKENGPNWETNNRLQRGAVKMTRVQPSWFKSHLEIRNIYINLLYKHQWNTRWAFARKHDILTRYFHMWKDHRRYGYILNRAFRSKTILIWNGLAFHRCLYNYWIEHYMAA